MVVDLIQSDEALSSAFAALGDATRRSILQSLQAGPATVAEIAAPHAMSQQAISKHLAVLERAGLIQKERVGRQHICRLHGAPLKAVAEWTVGYRQFWEESFDRLEDYLAEYMQEQGTESPAAERTQKKNNRAKPKQPRRKL